MNNTNMKKPLWEMAPDWANYLAQDKSGKWFWFENEPIILPNQEIWRPNFGQNEPAVHWMDSKERRK